MCQNHACMLMKLGFETLNMYVLIICCMSCCLLWNGRRQLAFEWEDENVIFMLCLCGELLLFLTKKNGSMHAIVMEV